MVVPDIPYQLFSPAKGFVIAPPTVLIDKPGSRSRTSTPDAPPPNVKVTESIVLSTQTT